MIDLSSDVLISQPGLSRLIGRMEERGLVLREDDPDDGRACRIRLTDKGAGLQRRVGAAHARQVAAEMTCAPRPRAAVPAARPVPADARAERPLPGSDRQTPMTAVTAMTGETMTTPRDGCRIRRRPRFDPERFEFGLNSFGENATDGERVMTDAETVRLLVDEAQLAESVGLDVFSVGEHYREGHNDSATPVLLAAAAQATTTSASAPRSRCSRRRTRCASTRSSRRSTRSRTAARSSCSAGRRRSSRSRCSATTSPSTRSCSRRSSSCSCGCSARIAVTWSGRFRSPLTEPAAASAHAGGRHPDLDRHRRQPRLGDPRGPVRTAAHDGDHRRAPRALRRARRALPPRAEAVRPARAADRPALASA